MHKRLFPKNEPAIRRLNNINARIDAVVENPDYTLPCPLEHGVRLVKRGCVDTIDQKLTEVRFSEMIEILRLSVKLLVESTPKSNSFCFQLFLPPTHEGDN